MKIFLLTSVALIAFAGNSVLCRLALGQGSVDAASFTTIRLISGAIVLWVLVGLSQKAKTDVVPKSNWVSAFFLLIYAACFSFAYVKLSTGTGALILFATVQFTIIFYSLWRGQSLLCFEWLGLAVAFLGFVLLTLPGVESPSIQGFVLMCIAGIAWGGYTLLGKQSRSPLKDTFRNFSKTLPFTILLSVIFFSDLKLSFSGILLAVLSGGLASGVGYAIWYRALLGLSAVQAGVLQLLVPVIATLGGIVFAQEAIGIQFVISSTLILGGILILVTAKSKAAQ